MESQENTEINKHEGKIRFLNVVNEGNRWFSFVVCPIENKKTGTQTNVILFALLDDLTGTTHTQIFNLAVEDLGFNEKFEPIGGGALNMRTRVLQDSIHYGGINDPTIERAIRHKAYNDPG